MQNISNFKEGSGRHEQLYDICSRLICPTLLTKDFQFQPHYRIGATDLRMNPHYSFYYISVIFFSVKIHITMTWEWPQNCHISVSKLLLH